MTQSVSVSAQSGQDQPMRPYDKERDFDAAFRIWKECGWMTGDEKSRFEIVLAGNRNSVADINGEAECIVMTTPGTVRYLREDLAFALVYGVTTSRVARRQGLASRLTAHRIADDVRQGAIVSGLGAFELGFYDRLGFGTGSYDHMFEIDPSLLRVPDGTRPRAPRRMTADDAAAMHVSRLARRRGHGACNLSAVEMTEAEVRGDDKGFGLGYDTPGGGVGHHLWCRGEGEWGPYRLSWLAYRTRAELHELLGLVAGLGDQVRLIKIIEPPGVPLIDFLDRPIRTRMMTKGAKFAQDYWFVPWWQMRINDLSACLARTRLPACSVRFNLEVTDPIESLLPSGAPWRGVGGDYVVTLGPASSAEPGRDAGWPTLRCTINTFTRLWLGVRPASDLAMTGELDAPPELVASLDETIRVPSPSPDWEF